MLQKVWVLRKLLFPMDELEAAEFLLDKLRATKNNAEFFDSMRRVTRRIREQQERRFSWGRGDARHHPASRDT